MVYDPEGALKLKAKGNDCFKLKQWEEAYSYYTRAILLDSKNAVLYSNRAMALMMEEKFEDVISDCEQSIALHPQAVKPYFNMSKALFALKDYDGAYKNSKIAQRLCNELKEWKSLPSVNELILKSRKACWDRNEANRETQYSELEEAVMEAYMSSLKDSGEEFRTEQRALLKEVFERARKPEDRKREVPDWALDDISYEVMTDPVITKSGTSYERSSITAHLQNQQLDPISREPMTVADLRPNLALREACEDFLAQNGWASDW